MIKASELLKKFPELLSGKLNSDVQCSGIASPENFRSGDLIVCDSESPLKNLSSSSLKPSLVITHSSLLDIVPNDIPSLGTTNPRLAHALIKQMLNDYDKTDSEWAAIHPTAVIHETASIHKSCRIGPNAVIGANVVLAEGTIVRSNSSIEHDSVLGKNCTIHSQVNIGYGSQIGNNVIIHAGTVIGNEGFGFAPDQNKHLHRVPHTGYVEIHDDVQIGSNCNIDRGTYEKTTIKRGSKIDALCHIAHNVVIGEDCILVAQSGIAGSTTIGNRVILSGHTAILDHLKIADDVTLVHRAGVTADITEKGMWGGTPAKPMKEYVKGLSTGKRLEKKIARFEQTISELKIILDEKD